MRLRLAVFIAIGNGTFAFATQPAISAEMVPGAMATKPKPMDAYRTSRIRIRPTPVPLSRPDFTPLWSTESPDLSEASTESFDPKHLNAIGTDKRPRDPWRTGDPALNPREQRNTPRAWASPLARDLPRVYPGNDRSSAPTATVPRHASPAARWITEVALLTLSVTGKITGTGRDTTDIGKPLLGFNNEPYATAVQGGIK